MFMKIPNQPAYTELYSYMDTTGTTAYRVRMQQCLRCGQEYELERLHSHDRVTYPIVDHILTEHLK